MLIVIGCSHFILFNAASSGHNSTHLLNGSVGAWVQVFSCVSYHAEQIVELYEAVLVLSYVFGEPFGRLDDPFLSV